MNSLTRLVSVFDLNTNKKTLINPHYVVKVIEGNLDGRPCSIIRFSCDVDEVVTNEVVESLNNKLNG
jgi:hypothetical protein